MMRIELDALDTLFFRDGKPFTMQEETWADILFPPHPSTFHGALCSEWLANNLAKLPAAGSGKNGEDVAKMVKITGIRYQRAGNVYYPLPRDLVQEKGKKPDDHGEISVQHLQYKAIGRDIHGAVSSPLPGLLYPPDGEKNWEAPENALISEGNLARYLSGKTTDLTARRLSDFICKDPKIGISRLGQHRSTAKGALYRIDMVRLQGENGSQNRLKFQLDFDGVALKDAGFLKLGGEAKAMRYTKCSSSASPLAPANLVGRRMFKIIVLTPAIFRQGWLPDFMKPNSFEADIGCEATLVAASLGRKLNIGGFDMEKRFPKPMCAAVPAGSVYYFETKDALDEKAAQSILEKFHNSTIMTADSQYEHWINQGFGLSVVGVCGCA